MVSAPSGISEWAAKATGGQAERQTDKVPREQGGEGGLGREEGTRAQTTHPLSYLPCPVGVRENTSSVSWGGKMAFLKNSFL